MDLSETWRSQTGQWAFRNLQASKSLQLPLYEIFISPEVQGAVCWSLSSFWRNRAKGVHRERVRHHPWTLAGSNGGRCAASALHFTFLI